MKTTIIIILILTTIEVAAQNHLIGIRGGANCTNITSNDFSRETDYRPGITGGVTYEYFLKKRFSIGADIIYNQRGFTDDYEIQTGEKITDKSNYDYLSVPVKIGFNNFKSGNKVFSFVRVGLIPSLLINATTTTPLFDTNGRITGKQTFNILNRVSKFDLAGQVEIGGGYKLLDRLWLTTSFILQHSLTTITNAEYFANTKIKHNGMTLDIGLKWALKKE